jgi:RNA ligase (TIGR02306 family)
MERKLASVQIIRGIEPIEDADLIELAIINNWRVVVSKKDGYKLGEKVIYCEIDSFLPIREEFEFLRKSSYKKILDQEGFRLKTIRLRGQISQGLILPLSLLEGDYNEGDDVTDLLGITKYEQPIDAKIRGKIKGLFPSFIEKTDEERVQNLTSKYGGYKDIPFYATEKLDGTSTTYYVKDGEFGVCSRNIELKEPEQGETPSIQWRIAQELGLKEKMIAFNKQTKQNIAIQGELIGFNIQGNPYKLKNQQFYIFTAFDINNYKKLGLDEIKAYASIFELNLVPIVKEYKTLPEIDDLIYSADGKSKLNPTANREGLVLRTYDNKISFKVISNNYLLKNEK